MESLTNLGPAIFLAGLLALLGIVIAIVFGRPLIGMLGDRFGQLFTGSDDSSRIVPEYSVAEARVNQGRYAEAVEQYRLVIAKFPKDTYAHIRIADLALKHLNDPTLAETELKAAFAKARGEDP